MAQSPTTIKVTNDELVAWLFKTGQSLIDMGFGVQRGFEVPVEYVKKENN